MLAVAPAVTQRRILLSALLLAVGMARALPAEAPAVWTLRDAVEHAMARNPDARLALHRIATAQSALQQANAAFWPSLQVQAGYVRSDNPMTAFGSILNQGAYDASLDFNRVPDVDNFNAKGIFSAPLYTGGRIVAARNSARALAEAARHDNAAIRNALGFEVARAFYTLLKARNFIEAAQASAESFEAHLANARHRFEAGALLKSELLDLEVRLAQAREDLVRANGGAALAERALRNLLGIEAGSIAIADSDEPFNAPTSGSFHNRPELMAVQERERSAEADLRGAQGARFPNVRAFASVDYDYGAKFDRDGQSYSAGLMAQWNLWDGHLARAKAREAEARLMSAREEQRKLRLALDLEAEQARLNLETASQRLAVSGKAVERADESATLTRRRFEQGLALAAQLIDAETALVAARIRRAEAEADRRIAVGALRKALMLPQCDPEPKQEGR